jgi:hypothetical protein
LAISALLGITGGLAGLVLVDPHAGSDMVALIRLALLMPAGVFVMWWMLGPGIKIEEVADTAEAPETDPDVLAKRMREVEHVFDNVAVPAAKRVSSDDERAWFRASIRRELPSEGVSNETWGLPRRTSAVTAPDAPRTNTQG